jgi:hypothetical protein
VFFIFVFSVMSSQACQIVLIVNSLTFVVVEILETEDMLLELQNEENN